MYTLQLFMDHLWNYQAGLEVHDSVPWETLPTIWNHLELVTSEVSRQSEDFPIWDPKISLFWQNKEVISSSLLESLSGCPYSWNIKNGQRNGKKKSAWKRSGNRKPKRFHIFLARIFLSFFAKDCLLTGQQQTFSSLTWLFVCHQAKITSYTWNGCWLHLSDQSHRKSAFSRPDQTRSDQQYKRNDLLSQTWEFSSSSQQKFFDQIRCDAILSQIHTTREACACKRYDKYRVIF